MHVERMIVWQNTGGFGRKHDHRAQSFCQLTHGIRSTSGPASGLDDNAMMVGNNRCADSVDILIKRCNFWRLNACWQSFNMQVLADFWLHIYRQTDRKSTRLNSS